MAVNYYSRVKDNATVSEPAEVTDCHISDNAQVYGNARIDNIRVMGNSSVFGNAHLSGPKFYFVHLDGDCKFGGKATFEGLKTPRDFVKKYGKGKVQVQLDTVTLTDVWDMG